MEGNLTLILVLAGFIQLVMLFAQLKLFSINSKTDEVIKWLRLLNSEIIDLRKDLKPPVEEKQVS